jgi:hypothetical protein
MMTSLGIAAVPAASGTIGSLEFEILDLDPDVAALIADVEAILCATLTPARRQPAPPVTGSDFSMPGGRDGPAVRRSAPRRAPVHAVRAAQRGPPTREDPRLRSTTPCERQVMASQRT